MRKTFPRFRMSKVTKGRIALVAVFAGATSTAAAGGAAAAALHAEPIAESVEYELTNQVEDTASRVAESAPQVLAVAEYKPVAGLDGQLAKAVDYGAQRAAAVQAEAERVANEASAEVGSSNSSGAVVKPAEGAFTSGFGSRWGTTHQGVDIAAPIGTPIYAVMDGTVINSGPASGYGQWIRIQHDDGSISTYGHMSTLGVSVGERVSAGQYIAGMGSEGHSTGSHLHFQIHPGGGEPVDPVPWFAQHGIYL